MADLSKLDWFANWQNGVAFIAAVVAGIWLGPLDAAHFTLVFVLTFATVRVAIVIIQTIWEAISAKP